MTNAFYTPLATKAIIVERETGMRLFWFWPLAALMLVISSSILFRNQPIVTLTVLLFALIPLCGLLWLELRGRHQSPHTLLSWHGGRLFLFEKGKHVRTLRSNQIQHIDITQGRTSAHLQIHTKSEVIDQKLSHLGRGQRLQIQRIVRCLQAELAYKNAFHEMPDELEKIANEI